MKKIVSLLAVLLISGLVWAQPKIMPVWMPKNVVFIEEEFCPNVTLYFTVVLLELPSYAPAATPGNVALFFPGRVPLTVDILRRRPAMAVWYGEDDLPYWALVDYNTDGKVDYAGPYEDSINPCNFTFPPMFDNGA